MLGDWNLSYEMKTNNHQSFWIWYKLFWILFISIVFIIAVIIPTDNDKNLKKIDDCIDVANEVGIDPNDSQRSEFIKNCYETNEEE